MLPVEQEALLGDILIYAKKILTFTKEFPKTPLQLMKKSN